VDTKAAASDDAVPDDANVAPLAEDLGAGGDGDEKATPKRRPRRARTRTPSSGGGETTEIPGDEAPPEAGADTASEPAAATDQAPKPRTRRSRARKPRTSTTEPAVEQAAVPAGGGGNGSGNGAGEAANPPALVGGTATAPEVTDPSDSSGPTKQPEAPKRRGWWNRLTQ
jgi:hypothetical protein